MRRPTSTKIGALIEGRYAIEGRIGEGGMARVYRALDLETQTPVAVKILSPDHFRRAGGVQLFLREAEAARAVDHPNIVRVLTVGERQDGRPYIVMELLEGETLGEYLARQRTMPLPLVLAMLRQVASGLSAAHRADIVHRDVKPDNVFLLGSKGDPVGAKLLDFGLAEVRPNDVTTRSGQAAGTLQYMAPEQVLDDGVTGRTDVYGLGVVIFRALTGQLPFDGADPVMVLAHQVWSKPPPPSWFLDGLPQAVDDVVASAVRKHPANRYACMADLVDDFDQLLCDPHGPVHPPAITHHPDVYEPRGDLAMRGAKVLLDQLQR